MSDMQYVNLGPTGLKVARICLGCMTYGTPDWRPWVLDEAASRPFFKRALELGFNFFDTADMYSQGVSEQVTGRILGDLATRDEVVIATKVFFPTGDGPNQRGLSRKHIMHAIDASLRRLGMEYVDLYQIHRFDSATPIEETMEALHDVVKAGKALHIGASSMWAWQLAKAQAVADRHGWTRFVSMQNYYNLVYREEEREMLPLCADQGLAVLPWSPLARGFLARPAGVSGSMGTDTATNVGTHIGAGTDAGAANATERSRTDTLMATLKIGDEGDRAIRDRVTALARARGVTNAQIALAWLLAKAPVTAPIIGASRISHLEDAAAAVALTLSDDEIEQLESPYRPHEVVGHA